MTEDPSCSLGSTRGRANEPFETMIIAMVMLTLRFFFGDSRLRYLNCLALQSSYHASVDYVECVIRNLTAFHRPLLSGWV